MSTMKRKVLTGLVVISLGSSGCAVNDVAPTGDYLPKSNGRPLMATGLLDRLMRTLTAGIE